MVKRMKEIVHSIKKFIHCRKVGRACRFGLHVTIDSKAIFEKANRLGHDSTFLNSIIG